MDKIKGQKIIAALYLITAHLSDNDPIKNTLRELGIALVEGSTQPRAATAGFIDQLLGAAVFANIISEKNASIIVLEVKRYVGSSAESQLETINTLFAPTLGDTPIKDKRTHLLPTMSNALLKKQSSISKISSSIFDTKSKRQSTIVSFIGERKSASIKDISALFPETSEKTIQRELGTLVASGQITKRGSKRWSVYMAVGS